jgi:hypothetical protein
MQFGGGYYSVPVQDTTPDFRAHHEVMNTNKIQTAVHFLKFVLKHETSFYFQPRIYIWLKSEPYNLYSIEK